MTRYALQRQVDSTPGIRNLTRTESERAEANAVRKLGEAAYTFLTIHGTGFNHDDHCPLLIWPNATDDDCTCGLRDLRAAFDELAALQ